MKQTVYSLIVLLCFLFTSCSGIFIDPRGEIIITECNVPQFDCIDVCDGLNVTLVTGQPAFVEVEAVESLQPYIETYVRNNTLIIKIKDGYKFRVGADYSRPRIYVYTEIISGITASGGSKVVSQGEILEPELSLSISGGSCFDGDINVSKVTADVNGGGKIRLGNSTVEKLSLSLSGGSIFDGTVIASRIAAEISGGARMVISGSVVDFNLNSSGGSVVEGYNLKAVNLATEMSGGGVLKLFVSRTLNVSASGGSVVWYRGDGRINSQDLSGGSKINRVD